MAKSKETDWVLLFVDRYTAVYLDSFGIEYRPQVVLNKIRDNQLLTVYLEYKIIVLLRVDFMVSLS